MSRGLSGVARGAGGELSRMRGAAAMGTDGSTRASNRRRH